MKYKIVIIILMLLTTSVILQAANIEVSQPTTLNLIGGDTQTVNLTVSYTGSGKATCTMSYSIPDGEGINITYIPLHFTLNRNSDQKVIMIINTSLALMPNIYTITTQVSAVSSTSSSGSKIKITPDPVEEPVDEPPVEEPPEETPTEEPDDIIDDDLGTNNPDTPYFWVIIIIFIGILLTLLYIYIRRRSKNE